MAARSGQEIREAVARKLGFFVNDLSEHVVFVRFVNGKMVEHGVRPAMQTEVKMWRMLFWHESENPTSTNGEAVAWATT
jgi:hypothetical protein